MNKFNTTKLSTILCLPAPDLQALGNGRSICVIPSLFIRPGQKFLLCPMGITNTNDNYLENYYRSIFQSEAKIAVDALEYDLPEIEYWASCEECTIVDAVDRSTAIESLSVWQQDWLYAKIKTEGKIFLTTLRTYKLISSFDLPGEIVDRCKIGKFLSLGSETEVLDNLPILVDRVFARRKQQLEKLTPPAYPALELLQSQVAQLALNNPVANILNYDLKTFLEWQETRSNSQLDKDWIDRITTVGNSSDGNEFEKLVRRSFIHLGFSNSLNNIKASLDPEATGGAGGIDIYCDSPFSLVGECKASKHESVPNSVSAQLIHLGNTHLGKDLFDRSVKIIFAAGKLTKDAQQAAVQNQINIMTPATLQRLVTFKSQYPGAVNLHELEKCLRQESFGQDADNKVNQFIDSLDREIKTRSHIVSILKDYLDSQQVSEIGVEKLHGLYIGHSRSQPSLNHSDRELYDILIELSSPLSGYLGRNKGQDWQSDRFYFLRHLQLV
jgi:Domain of unknown function (DUF1802)/Restriction endonuclease